MKSYYLVGKSFRYPKVCVNGFFKGRALRSLYIRRVLSLLMLQSLAQCIVTRVTVETLKPEEKYGGDVCYGYFWPARLEAYGVVDSTT